jgi:serine/threonine protein kinase
MPTAVLRVGRYVLFDAIASGGMASVHLGRMIGPAGFARTIAVKRLHPHLATDPEFVSMFLDEARLAARVQHPNVVSTVDVFSDEGELFLVMDYIRGESLSHLLAASGSGGSAAPPSIVTAVLSDVLAGLHAAHEAKDENGEPLEIVHRDVSPQNILVGVDGLARVADFGVAKAASRIHSTRDGRVKGKLAYMSPEQLRRAPVDRRADVYAAAVVLWEAVTGRRLFRADDAAAVVAAVLEGHVPSASTLTPSLPRALDDLIAKGLARAPEARFATALEFAEALEAVMGPPSSPRDVAAWVATLASVRLEARSKLLESIERAPPLDASPEAPVLAGQPKSRAEVRAISAADTRVLSPPIGSDVSQVTGVAVPAERRVAKRVGARIVGSVVLAGLAAIAVVMARAHPAPRMVAVAGPVASTVDASTLLAVPEPSASSSGSSTSVRIPLPIRPARGTPPSKSTAPGVPAANNCDPSFTFDSSGVKHFKPWCL